MNRIDKLIRSAIKESMDEKADELHSMIQDEDWNPNGPVNISSQPGDIAEDDEFEVEDDYVMDKIKRECEDDPESESCRKHKEYAGLTDGGELDETLYGGQKKLDRNKNGRLDKQDFKLLRKSKGKKEVDEIDVSKLKKGGKYKYKSPSFEDELEYNQEHEYKFGEPMHSFKGKKMAGHLMGKGDVESYVSDFDRELSKLDDAELGEGIGYHDNIDSDYFHEKTGGMYNMDDDFEDVEPEDTPLNKRRPTDDEYIDFEEMRPTEKKSFFSRMKSKLGLDETDEMEEGNAFTGALAKARKSGDDEFEVGGKRFETKEGDQKFIQKAMKKMEKKGTEGSFKEYCGGEVTKTCIDKAMKSGDPKLVKKANFAKNIKAYKGAEHKKKSVKESVELSESEMIDLIEQIVLEQKSDKSFGGRKPKGMAETEKAQKGSKKENEDYIKSVTKKFKDYLKDGSKGSYETNPKHFPKGNGELAKMEKMAYQPDNPTSEYIDNFTAAGLENLVYDEIHPNEDWVNSNMEGSSKTGNNHEWANAVDTGVNKKRNQIRKDNLLGAVKQMAYNKAPQPVVDDAKQGSVGKFGKNFGKDAGKKATKILNQLESKEDKKDVLLSEEFNKMKNLINYNKKTQ